MSDKSMMSPKTRSAAVDYSSVNSGDFKGGVAPAGVNYAEPFQGKGGRGPSQVIEGIYTQPVTGGGKF
jgi:hypothetical protein